MIRRNDADRKGVSRIRCQTRQLEIGFWSWSLNIPAFGPAFLPESAQNLWKQLATSGAHFADRLHPEDRDLILLAFRTHLDDKRPLHLLCRIKLEDDCFHVFSIHCDLPKRTRATGVEVTGTAQLLETAPALEVRVHSVEQRYHELFDGAHELIILTDLKGAITDMNRAAQRRFGYDTHEAIGKSLSELTLKHGDTLKACLNQLLGGARIEAAEYEFETRLGHAFTVELNIRTLFGAGRPTGFQLQAWDLTERKRNENALRVLSGRLLRARDEEQRRVARELHDATAQELAALALNLRTISSAPLSDAHQRLLSDSIGLAKACLQEVRTISYLLHPPLLDEIGLSSALEWLCGGFGERSGLKMRVRVDPDIGRLAYEIEVALFRVAQEALNNVHRHSGSSQAAVRLTIRCGSIIVTVADSGKGFPAGSRRPRNGVGLASMRERLRLVGGALRLRSSPRGTVIQARVPLNQPQKETPDAEHFDR